MKFLVDSLGAVTLNNASVTVLPSPTLKVGQFKPGTYNGYSVCNDYGQNCGGNVFTTGVPGVGEGGRISGSIARKTNHAGGEGIVLGDDFNANWTSGAVKGHPYEALLTKAKITSTAYNWGVMGTAGNDTQATGWHAGDIIGVVQNGKQLSITNFGKDNIPDATLAFDLCPTSKPC